MRSCVVLLCGLLVGASGYVMQMPTRPMVQPRFAPAIWLHRQKLVLELFDNVFAKSENPMIMGLAEEFSMDNAMTKYSMENLMTEFRSIYEEKGLLPKQEIFSEYNKDHLEELQLIYKMLYFANDFEIFYDTAAWARQNVHPEIFVNALYAAVMHRKDTEKFAVPAPYEIFPNYFIPRDDLAKAMLLFKNSDTLLPEITGVHSMGNVYTVDVNYTGAFFDNDEESKVAYFLEDVGLNSYYYFINLNKGHWSNCINDPADRRGEYWYYIIRQLNARYNLERYTNGLGEIEGLTWNKPVTTGYDSMLMYNNGKHFPERLHNTEINVDDASYLTGFENRISTMVEQMDINDKTAVMNAIWDLISADGNNYDRIARQTLGGKTFDDSSTRLPSTIEHYATSLRDPVFWQLNKNMLNIFNTAMNSLEPYCRSDLYYPGVEIMNVEVKKMQTYFDYYQFDVNDLINADSKDQSLHVKFGQPRLNHKPFSIMVNVSSLVAQKALIKIFIGPKFKPTEISLKKDLLKQLDSFEYTLKVGTNIIIKKSDDINNIAFDFDPVSTLLKKIEAAEFGLQPLYFTDLGSIVGYPSRLILPKGTTEGAGVQLYVMVASFVKTQPEAVPEMEFNTDILSPGFPFDRKIEDTSFFDLPNTMFKDIVITHKGDNKVLNYGEEGITKKWYSTGSGDYTYDPEAKKSFDYSSKQKPSYKPYDYQSKKGTYETKKFDYETEKEIHATTKMPLDDAMPDQEQNPELNVIPLTDRIPSFSDEVDVLKGDLTQVTVHPTTGRLMSVQKQKDESGVIFPHKIEDQMVNSAMTRKELLQQFENEAKMSPVNMRVLQNILRALENDDTEDKMYY